MTTWIVFITVTLFLTNGTTRDQSHPLFGDYPTYEACEVARPAKVRNFLERVMDLPRGAYDIKEKSSECREKAY